MKISYIIFSLLLLLPVTLLPRQHYVLQDGEVLRYKVKWAIFRLGTITIRTDFSHSDSDTGSYKISMHVESNPHLPFISIDEINESIVHLADGMSRSFYGRYKNGRSDYEIECNYQPDTREALYTQRNCVTNHYSRIEILRDIDPFLDGPTLVLFTRKHIHSNRSYHMPTMIDGKINATVLKFSDLIEFIEVDALDGSVMAKRYDGYADWQGGTEAGLSGEFIGWISADSAAILLRAEMKVLLGSIVTELESYERIGWDPPILNQTATINGEI
jgi:hypothetical protein